MRKPLLFIFYFLTFFSLSAQEVRTINGSSNNLRHSDMGAVGSAIIRVVTNGYADQVAEPGGLNRPNARYISNFLFDQEGLINDPRGMSDYTWVFGQFLDHDIVLVGDEHEEAMPIPVPANDPHFDPAGSGRVIIPMSRSAFDPESGTGPDNPRRNLNEITAWIDASNVYGSDVFRASWLRTYSGGKLKTAEGGFLPYNTIDGQVTSDVDPDAPEMAMENPFVNRWFVAGDVRANENILLTSMHTLFVLEHNRICEELSLQDSSLSDEYLYQAARRRVGALIQAITFEEWLPSLGIQLDTYEGYNSELDAHIMNVFSAAAFRYGHTTINSEIIRMDNSGEIIPQGNTTLRHAFFNPAALEEGGGIMPLLKGMATQVQQNFDCKMIDDLRNFLFGPPGAGGLDLAAINIQRGRDRGLPDYNTLRADLGMEKLTSFNELSSDPEVNQIFYELYGDVNQIDPWVGMLAEDHMPDALFGETALEIVKRQFQHLRDGDRFYYLVDPAFTAEEITEIHQTRFADILRRNTNIVVQDEVFVATPHQSTTSIAVAEPSGIDLGVYPNPASGSFYIRLTSKFKGNGRLSITNNLGQMLLSRMVNLEKGDNVILIDPGPVSVSGLLQVQLRVASEMLSEKLLYLSR